jgi:zinc transporter 2
VRLAVVIVIATIFIAVEIIGGTIAKSIAIISDAIHLVSDLLGFAFSFLFLYLSKKEMDEKVSFGYHRMELIGALANIFIVWTMVLFIIFEATLRIINKEFVEKPAIMLITAIAGLLINIILYKILHGGASHSHGLMADEHDHSHSHGSSEIEGSQVCSDECNDENCNRTVKETHCHRGNDKSVHRHGKIKMDSAFNPTINNGLTDRLNEEYCEEKH